MARDMYLKFKEAYNGRDLEKFERLCETYPEQIKSSDGPRFLYAFAEEGLLDFAKLLVDYGVNVNEFSPPDSAPEDQEGCIVDAARHGHYDFVEWLLDQGSRINHEHDGITRCPALNAAARNNHIEIVKLLIKHGAYVNTIRNGKNPLMQAEQWKHKELIEYFKSLGLRPLSEIAPRNLQESHQAFLSHVEHDLYGNLSDWSMRIWDDPEVKLRSSTPNEEWRQMMLEWERDAPPYRSLFTVGLADHAFALQDDSRSFFPELYLYIPNDLTISGGEGFPKEWQWILDGFRLVIRGMLDHKPWEDEQVVTMYWNGNPPQPLTQETEMCGWADFMQRPTHVQLPDYRDVYSRLIAPIYECEREWISQHDNNECVDKLWSLAPECVSLNRPRIA